MARRFRLALVFNVQGSELVFLLLLALVILGPDKLPDAVRKFGRLYGEMKKMANGFQGELRQALDEPMKELKSTSDLVRNAARFDLDPKSSGSGNGDGSPPAGTPGTTTDAVAAAEAARPAPPTRPDAPVGRDTGLNFGAANPRRLERTATDEVDAVAPPGETATVDTPGVDTPASETPAGDTAAEDAAG